MSRQEATTRYDSALLILLSANQECHPFTSSHLAHDLVVRFFFAMATIVWGRLDTK